MPARAQAEPAHPPDSIAGRLVGTWSFASSVNTRKDGSTFDRWGANPRGIFMFDRAGNYAQIIVGFGVEGVRRQDLLRVRHLFGGRSQEASHHAHRVLFGAKLAGTSQNRDIMLLTADEFKYSNPLTSLGAIAEVLWKRIDLQSSVAIR